MTIFINEKEKCLIDSKTGEIIRPQCYQDLIAYHAYLLSKNRKSCAQSILKDIVAGEKVISKMIFNHDKYNREKK